MDRFIEERLAQRGPQTQEQLNNFNRMIAKKERQGGLVTGYHGTAESLAREIMEKGFENNRDIEGGYGVYFWDEEVSGNAREHGREKAKRLGEEVYAVIEAQLKNARPDLVMGRPQWVTSAEDATIKNVIFYKLKEEK